MSNEIAWAAGLFDGEGCISIGYVSPTKRSCIINPSYRLTVKVTMGCRKTIERFGKVVEFGSFHEHQSKSKNVNASYSWVAMAKKAYAVLKTLEPFLITKSEECKVAIEFSELPDGRKGGKGGCAPIDEKLLQKKHELYLRCCQLKPRWRFRKTFPKRKPEFRKTHL